MVYKITLGDELNSKEIPVLLAYIAYDVVQKQYILYKMYKEIPDEYSAVIIEETINAIENDIKALGSLQELEKYIQPFVNCIKIKALTKEKLTEEVEDFIEETIDLYRQSDFYEIYEVSPYRFYTCGGCGEFFSILQAQYPFARSFALCNFNHILTEIEGNLYDVSGLFDVLTDDELTMYLLEYNPKEDKTDPGILGSTSNYIYYFVPSNTPQQKVLCNFAFSLLGAHGYQGPTGVRFLQVLESFKEEERKEAFTYFHKHNYNWFQQDFERYIYKIKNNFSDYIQRLQDEAEGVYIPV